MTPANKRKTQQRIKTLQTEIKNLLARKSRHDPSSTTILRRLEQEIFNRELEIKNLKYFMERDKCLVS